MGESTTIGWTTATQNFWRGCDKVSPGCAACYMFRDQERYGRDPSVVVRTSDSTFYAPLRSRKWRELPSRSMVFTCSWSDFFHEAADEWREDAWDVIRQRPDLVWQILTKRPELIAERLPPDWGEGWPNVWLGVSIENRRFVGRADVLREVPAALRFISAEPLLGPLIASDGGRMPTDYGTGWEGFHYWDDGRSVSEDLPELVLDAVDWLIVGGESGPGARRMDLDWVRALVSRARARSVAVFVKQDYGPRPDQRGRIPDDLWIHEWPEALGIETSELALFSRGSATSSTPSAS